jgi:F420H(2)-dependent quinone reductase
MGKQSVLLLYTIGRNSGKIHATTLSYYPDGENYLIVASNWGQEQPPDWFLNLEKTPITTIQVKNVTIRVKAKRAEGKQYQQLWELVTQHNSQYIEYQNHLVRKIPIMILIPITASNSDPISGS